MGGQQNVSVSNVRPVLVQKEWNVETLLRLYKQTHVYDIGQIKQHHDVALEQEVDLISLIVLVV